MVTEPLFNMCKALFSLSKWVRGRKLCSGPTKKMKNWIVPRLAFSLTTVLALCTLSHSSTQYRSRGATGGSRCERGAPGGEEGEPAPPGLRPRPASRCTHSIPDTRPPMRDRPVMDAERPALGFSTLYFVYSENLFK